MPAPRAAPKPKAAIRRFDVFAEYNRLTARREGMRAAQAKGHGLWLAKLVAARRFRRDKGEAAEAKKSETPKRRTKWKSLSDVPQTDKLFDREIVSRMGREFYRRVFSPAIAAAVAADKSYVAIRDSIRKGWKAEPA